MMHVYVYAYMYYVTLEINENTLWNSAKDMLIICLSLFNSFYFYFYFFLLISASRRSKLFETLYAV